MCADPSMALVMRGLKVQIQTMSKALATNVASIVLSAALVLGFAFTFATPAKADTLSNLQAQVAALMAQIQSLSGGTTMTTGACFTFTTNYTVGRSGNEVVQLQKFLNAHGFTVSTTGAGSAGNETSYFGTRTKMAVVAFQNANAASVLTPVGLTSGTGYWGPSSRAAANGMCTMTGTTGTGTGTGTGTVTPTGSGVTVAAGTQPAATLAPAGAIRVPFTTFMLTNNSSAAVTVNGVTVQRTGLAQDNNFAGVVLVNSTGLQIGNSQTFDSNHMATVGGTFTINPGQTMTLTVAGNIANSTTAHSGEIPSITVTAVNTTAPVSGSLPIIGASQTINTTLAIGSITTGVSSFDPNNSTTKNFGDTAIKFTGVRFTAGSGEDMKMFSIRWRLNGSASASDIGNVMTNVNGTTYPATISADGRYYTSTFPGGILLSKGNSVDVYAQGDLVGSNSSGRVVELDIDKTSDVYFVGQTYGYGIPVTLAGSCVVLFTSTAHATCMSTAAPTLQPWLQGSTVTVQAGSVTAIQKATSVPSANVALNVPNQVLGGFTTNFLGENVTIQGMTLNMGTSSATVAPFTLVRIVDENGVVVAGPNDMTTGSASLTFTSSITFKTGSHTYTIQGKLASTFLNGDTFAVTVRPSTWTSPQGANSGNAITGVTSIIDFPLNTMTVRAAALNVSASPNPAAQNVVAGSQSLLVANIQLDASQSGEDIRLSSFPIFETNVSGTPSGNLTGCQLMNGTTALNTGTNVLNSVVAGSNTVTFDNSLTVPKGIVVTLALNCNLSSAAVATNSFQFGVSSLPTATGVQSGNTIVPTLVSGNSGLMTISTGAVVAVTIDPSSPSYTVQADGTTGVTVGVIKLRASNENFNLSKLGLTAANGLYGASSTGSGNAASAAGDLVTVYLYNSSNILLGTAIFTGTGSTATSTLISPFMILRDTDTLITVKADLARIGVSSAGGIGNLITIDPLNFEGTGASSGQTVRGGATAGVAGVRLFNTFPTLALDTLPTTGIADGRLTHFKVTSNSSGPVGINQFNFSVSTTSATVTNVQLYGFTDSGYSQAISGQGTGGQIGSTLSSIPNNVTFSMTPTTNPVEVPAGQTYYFELRSSVAGVITGSSVVTKLLGDSAYPTAVLTSGYNVATSSALTAGSNFIWSGNSTTTSASGMIDWSNGFSISGLPSSGLIQTRSN